MVGESVRCRSFIGRHKELSALVDARKALGQSNGSFVLISGEAGIGKSRLLTEFIALSHEGRARNLVSSECLQRAGRPLGPIRSAVRSLLSRVRFEDLEKVVSRALAQILPEFMAEMGRSSSEVTLEKDELFEALFTFFKAVCAKRATVLMVEDIHWADESTLEFLHYLARRLDGTRLLILATFRTDELARDEPLLLSLSPLFREPSLRHIRVQPLGLGELHELIESTLDGHAPIPPPAFQDIEQRSEGNPFFAEELVKDYLERDAHKTKPALLPLSIRAAIAARCGRLDAGNRAILEYAAVLGYRFDPEVLALVMGKDLEAITVALRKARDLNLIIDDAGGRLSCRFRHALTRQTIYEDVPFFQARRLHGEILSALEAHLDAGRHIEELAYHAWRSEDRDRTIRYNERAGDAAFALRALPEALVCYNRALAAATEPLDRARLYERIGSLERLQGRYKQSCDAFEEAMQIHLDRGDVNEAARIAPSMVGQMYNMQNEIALPYAERFLESYQDQIAQAPLDHLLVVCARIAGALYDFSAAERYVSSVADPDHLAPNAKLNYLIVQLMRHTYAGNADEWLRYADRVDELLPELSPESLIGVENALALTGIYLGTNERIEQALETAERTERECSFRAQRLYMIAVKATYLYQRGDISGAVGCIEEVVSGRDVNTAVRVAASIAVHIAVSTGDDALWRQFDQKLLLEARQHLGDPDCIFLLGAHAALSVAQGELDVAQSDLRLALSALSFAAPEAMFILIHAVMYLPVEELDRVVELTKVAARHAGGAASRATDVLVRAIVASRNGKPEEAVALGDDASRKYAALGWPLFEAKALELAGKRDLAVAIYERCGAVADARRLRTAHASTGRVFEDLTSREVEIAALASMAYRNDEIAKRLDIGTKTVEKHLSSIFRKLKVRSRAQLIAVVASSKDHPAITTLG